MRIFSGAKHSVLSPENFRLFLGGNKTSFPEKDSSRGKYLIEKAEEALNTEIPQLYASIYARYVFDGNRKE